MTQELLFPECAHYRVIQIPESSGPHHAREVCSDCRKFLRWVPKPETLKRREENAAILTALAKREDLNAWERRFVRNLITHKNISPSQRATLLELRDQYFLPQGL